MHLSRKAFHASGVLIVLVYRGLGLERTTAAWLLGGIVALLLAFDLLRALWPPARAWFMATFAALVDPKDERGLNGSTLYFAGCALAVALFPPDPACGGILALALGDSFAAIVGSSVRSPRWGRVSLAGSLACLVAATLGCAVFAPWPAAGAAGAAAAGLEAGSGSKADNLTMPVGAALVLWLLA